ncbi:MAG: hypothetical protein KDD50_02390, partial [Bdellovibrionales bacterium]|nr:hypothetical protein [Bdellovibrionales bacterium]
MRFNKYKLKPSTSPLLFTILFFSSSMTWANYACLYPFAKLKKDESLIQSSEWSPQKVTDKLQQVILATHVLNHKPVIIGDENALDLLRFVQRNPYRAETGSILQALTHFSAKRTSSVRIFTAQMVRSNKEKGKNPDNNLELMRPLIFLNK